MIFDYVLVIFVFIYLFLYLYINKIRDIGTKFLGFNLSKLFKLNYLHLDLRLNIFR